MAKARSSRGPKAGPRQLSDRELREAYRYVCAAGDGEQLRWQLKAWLKRRRGRGQPRKDGIVPLIDSILAVGGPKPRRPQIRAMADALWDFGWFVQLSEPARATKPSRETPTVAPWDPRPLALNREALVARIEKELRKRLKAR